VAKISLHLVGREKPVELELKGSGGPDGYVAEIAGRTLGASICAVDDGQGRLVVDGAVTPFFFHREGKNIDVWMNGRTFRFSALSGARRTAGGRPAAGAGSGEMRAPMPGTILKVCVGEGEAVKVNQPLVIMVSMKMEMTLTAPFDGRVKSVACRPEQMVEMHAVLVTLEERADGGATA